jgi:hypothetical protein
MKNLYSLKDLSTVDASFCERRLVFNENPSAKKEKTTSAPKLSPVVKAYRNLLTAWGGKKLDANEKNLYAWRERNPKESANALKFKGGRIDISLNGKKYQVHIYRETPTRTALKKGENFKVSYSIAIRKRGELGMGQERKRIFNIDLKRNGAIDLNITNEKVSLPSMFRRTEKLKHGYIFNKVLLRPGKKSTLTPKESKILKKETALLMKVLKAVSKRITVVKKARKEGLL